ncbi:MAG: transcription termination factor NusA [Pseudomonadota bacterium]|jgi:N utilization substance protein A|nr:transcription termination/antitermination protein NusA [Syntrophobacterales bacterium]MDI9555134.1 transcription termination factor NusA [Pseudomonadota bacterium]NLX32293.1 transcription termination/antitermination protein NusA [Deltaproteobacteria bacterium]HNU86024.1 transcription termination factor NusA [Syntrophales bacterium]HNZ35517.1 transcription termination factor NusA [Syntrophales bacterium]
MFPELKRLIEQMGKDKGIEKEVIIEALESAILTAARKKLGPKVELESRYNEEAGELEVFQFKTVVEKVLDPETQIALDEAKQTLDEEAEPGDSLGMKIDAASFGRIAVQTAKQIIIQKVKDAERDKIYDEYKDRKSQIVSGFVQRFEGGSIIVNLGRAEAVIPPSEQIHRETYKRGDRIRAFIVDVKKISKGPQIVLSRTHPGFLRALFELEVPEISEGFIEIVNVAREPGNRSKISVRTLDKDIDPVGACVGMRGSRVQSVVQELKGEKIDIVPFSEDSVKYICSALSPAKVSKVFMYEDERSMEVIVPDDQLSLAIGKSGQNVRLAVRLTGWKIDVKNESMLQKQAEEGPKILMKIPDLDEETAEMLFKEGYKNVAALSSADPEALKALPGMDAEKAQGIVERAAQVSETETETVGNA